MGKTVVSAALARAASLQGLSALVVEVEGRGGVAKAFGLNDLSYTESIMSPADDPPGAGEIRARSLTSDEALIEYLNDHGMKRLSKRLISTGVIDVVATSTPGIKDILVLGKVKQLAAEDEFDLIILDAPASGHAITFLRSARALLDSVTVGPIEAQARGVMELLEDHTRCQVMLVTLAEETPVNELIETAYSLEEDVGVALAPVVVNGLYPPMSNLRTTAATAATKAGAELDPHLVADLEALRKFRRERTELQQEQLDRLAQALPLPQLTLPFLFDQELGPMAVDDLARQLVGHIEELDASAITGATP